MLIGFLEHVRRSLREAVRELLNPYRPELHYMRGPGPKCREAREREAQAMRQAAAERHPATARLSG